MSDPKARPIDAALLSRLGHFHVVDGHTHFDSIDLSEAMLADQKRQGADQFCILVIGRSSDSVQTNKIADAVWFKHRMPDRVFAFGGLDFGGMFDHGEALPDIPFERQLETLIACGFDGLKLLCGKPDVRKAIGHPLDGPAFEPMLRRLEETQFPLLWHVGDPAEFWDEDAVPLWAKQHRWWYDNTHPPKAQIDAELSRVLSRHPRLNLILPHFYFLGGDLGAADRLLREHPNVSLDLAPGVEMFHQFTADHAAAREFFLHHADRIVFGTDIGMDQHTTGPLRGVMIRLFLETDARFDVPDDPAMTPDERPALHGLALPAEVLRRIYAENFCRIVGRRTPRPLVMSAVRAMLQAHADRDATSSHPSTSAGRILRLLAE